MFLTNPVGTFERWSVCKHWQQHWHSYSKCKCATRFLNWISLFLICCSFAQDLPISFCADHLFVLLCWCFYITVNQTCFYSSQCEFSRFYVSFEDCLMLLLFGLIYLCVCRWGLCTTPLVLLRSSVTLNWRLFQRQMMVKG